MADDLDLDAIEADARYWLGEMLDQTETRDAVLALVAEVRRLRAALEAALIPAACIDKDDQAGDAVVQILLAAVREQDRG